MNAEFQRIARKDKKVFLNDQCKEIEENNRMGKTRDLFKKIRDLMNYGMRFVTLYRRQGSRPSPWKRNAKKQMTGWVGLTNSCEKKRRERQRRKGKIYPFECKVPKNSKER